LRRHLSDAAQLLARLRSFIGEDLGSTSDSAGLPFAGDFALQYSPRLSLPPRVALTEPHPRDTWANLAEMERFLDNRKCRASLFTFALQRASPPAIYLNPVAVSLQVTTSFSTCYVASGIMSSTLFLRLVFVIRC
jgi:hypothetical protein